MRLSSFFLVVCQGFWAIRDSSLSALFELRGDRVAAVVDGTVLEARAVVHGDILRLEGVSVRETPRDWRRVVRYKDVLRFLYYRRHGVSLHVRSFNDSVVRLVPSDGGVELTLVRSERPVRDPVDEILEEEIAEPGPAG
jgi:hypothetical protein